MSQLLQPTMGMGGRLFWAYFWRSILIGLLIGVVAGILGAVFSMVAPPLLLLINLAYFVAVIATGIIVFSIIFSKRYPRYTVALVDNTTNEILPRHWKRGLRPWWSYTWRCIALSFLFMIPVGMVFALTFGDDIKKSMAKAECQQLVGQYEQYKEQDDAANMQAVAEAFQTKQCPLTLEPPTEEEIAAQKAKGTAIAIGSVIGFILGIALQFKLFQIVLRKRYRDFHVQIIANESAA